MARSWRWCSRRLMCCRNLACSFASTWHESMLTPPPDCLLYSTEWPLCGNQRAHSGLLDMARGTAEQGMPDEEAHRDPLVCWPGRGSTAVACSSGSPPSGIGFPMKGRVFYSVRMGKKATIRLSAYKIEGIGSRRFIFFTFDHCAVEPPD